jgi:hypothetical protein
MEQRDQPVDAAKPVKGPGRLQSECIALAEEHGSRATLDDAFGREMEEIIERRREPLDGSRWD